MKQLIVNSDDLGYTIGINEGIIKAYKAGIVTSTSLMVRGKATSHAVQVIKEHPELGLGLHFQIEDEDWGPHRRIKNIIAMTLIKRTQKEFLNQIDIFKQLTGKMPDHVDSHHNTHFLPRINTYITLFCQKNNIPVRGQTNYIESFYGIPSIKSLSIDNLINILRNLPEGISELVCHPGFVSADLKSKYSRERELELQTLTSQKIIHEIDRLKIKLINWNDFNKKKSIT